eukprot:TRINITY_DN15202_c0_g1_i1.p1 TRINITY_DN15202_c0_g1~~TRINITY_DN15202_c0_g1_i1.p1  ORF type:complete len:92 (+),score=10.06 TRINITY_DN15202_c0_g1_i1:40-315(+)
MATGSSLGADIIAKAWSDEEFKRKLLTDTKAVLNSFGYTVHTDLVMVENTSTVHNLVVLHTFAHATPVKFWDSTGLVQKLQLSSTISEGTS